MADREFLWQPSEERVERSQMNTFMRAMGEKNGFAGEWAGLHRWSVEHRDQFWGEMFSLADIKAAKLRWRDYKERRKDED